MDPREGGDPNCVRFHTSISGSALECVDELFMEVIPWFSREGGRKAGLDVDALKRLLRVFVDDAALDGRLRCCRHGQHKRKQEADVQRLHGAEVG